MPLAAIPLIQGAIGLGQTIFGNRKAKKAERALENLQSPEYSLNKGILNYYNEALDRYNVNPTASALYKRNTQNILRNTATGLRALQDRRSALGGTSSIIRAMNDATLDTEVAAENQRNQRFGDLQGATMMKAGEEDKAFQINKMLPFERKYNLLAAKAGAANQTANAGLSNIFGGLQNYSNYQLAKDIYGNEKSSGTTSNATIPASTNKRRGLLMHR